MTPDSGQRGGDHLIVLACGTRGDVQPLSVLARRLHDRSPGLCIDFVTHSAHQEWMQLDAAVQCHWLPEPPARIWVDAAASASSGRNASVRAALLDCCIGAVRAAEQQQCQRRLVICNLFSLEGFHLAEALGCGCVVVSPCLVPYPAPASFERRFRAAFPQLHRRLQAAGPGEVGWGEVEHWMWPLFTGGWQAWRQDVLGLAAVPLLAEACTGAQLPPPPPLLYGLPELLVPRPGYWPDSVHLCGFLLDTRDDSTLPSAHLLPEAAALLAGGSTVAVDLGSMPRMGFVLDAAGFVAALRGALRAAGLRGLLLTGAYQPLAEACRVGAHADEASVLLAVAEVPHAVLLPRCCAVVHHGGAGTTAAALAAGVPQLVCPLHFDQFAQADRVEHLGVGLQLPGARQLLAGSGSEGGRAALTSQLAARLRRLQQPAFRCECFAVAAELRQQPDGLEENAQRILEHLSARHPATASARRGVTPAVAAMLAAEPVAGASDSSAADAAGQLNTDITVPASQAQLCELSPGFSVHTTCPDEARFIHHEIVQQRCYLKHGVTVNEGDIVIDCGANIGLFTLSLLMAAPAPGRIIAVEPLPPNVAMLRQNLALHAQPHTGSCNVRVLPAALGAAGGSRPFTYFPHMPGNSTAVPAEKTRLQAGRMPVARFADQRVVQCPVMTLSEVVRQKALPRVDLLKIDVEGLELEVLFGIEEQHWPRIRQVVAEVHAVIDAGGSRVEAVRMLLRSHGLDSVAAPSELEGLMLVYAVRHSASV